MVQWSTVKVTRLFSFTRKYVHWTRLAERCARARADSAGAAAASSGDASAPSYLELEDAYEDAAFAADDGARLDEASVALEESNASLRQLQQFCNHPDWEQEPMGMTAPMSRLPAPPSKLTSSRS